MVANDIKTDRADKKWLNTAAMAELYGVSRFTIRLWEKAGQIPAADRSRGKPRWSSLDVAEWDLQRRIKAEQAREVELKKAAAIAARDAGTLRASI